MPILPFFLHSYLKLMTFNINSLFWYEKKTKINKELQIKSRQDEIEFAFYYQKYSTWNSYFLKRGRIPLLSLNEFMIRKCLPLLKIPSVFMWCIIFIKLWSTLVNTFQVYCFSQNQRNTVNRYKQMMKLKKKNDIFISLRCWRISCLFSYRVQNQQYQFF